MNSVTKANWVKRAASIALAGMAITGGARALQRGPTQQDAISNLRNWGHALSLYAFDYDETFPVFSGDAQFEAQVRLYHDYNYDLRPMRSPINGSLYHANPDLSGRAFAFFEGPVDEVPVLTESVPSLGTKPYVMALDGAVYRNGQPVNDTVAAAAGRASILVSALHMYAQDYDELLPLKMDSSSIKEALYPYLKSLRPFTVSLKGGEFVFNPSLGGKGLWEFPDPDEVIAVRSPEGSVSATLSGQVYVNGKRFVFNDPSSVPIEVIYARRLAIAVSLYTQDYDEVLPNTRDRSVFKAQIRPYLRSDQYFTTPSGKNYLLNPAVSGVSLSSLASPSETELFRNPEAISPGKSVIAYTDFHVAVVR